jgi:hypothetical protein
MYIIKSDNFPIVANTKEERSTNAVGKGAHAFEPA